MPIAEDTIHSISEYIEAITSLKGEHLKLWFRGHSSHLYTLCPTIYRTPYSWRAEKALLSQFKARGSRFLPSTPTDDYEWLFIMQHYATPTRLLDWTESAMVALAFAVQYRKPSHNDVDADVWCLDPLILNSRIHFFGEEDEPIPNICGNKELQNVIESQRHELPLAIIGPQNTDRIVAQRGVFTIFPNKDCFAMESLENAETFLHRIIIPKENVETICEDLYYIGITESTLFPELTSISKELRKERER